MYVRDWVLFSSQIPETESAQRSSLLHIYFFLTFLCVLPFHGKGNNFFRVKSPLRIWKGNSTFGCFIFMDNIDCFCYHCLQAWYYTLLPLMTPGSCVACLHQVIGMYLGDGGLEITLQQEPSSWRLLQWKLCLLNNNLRECIIFFPKWNLFQCILWKRALCSSENYFSVDIAVCTWLLMKERKLSMNNEQAKCFSIDMCELWVKAK